MLSTVSIPFSKSGRSNFKRRGGSYSHPVSIPFSKSGRSNTEPFETRVYSCLSQSPFQSRGGQTWIALGDDRARQSQSPFQSRGGQTKTISTTVTRRCLNPLFKVGAVKREVRARSPGAHVSIPFSKSGRSNGLEKT